MDDEIIFTAKHKDWVVVKKLLIDEKTTPQEIAASLASIEDTISRKSYEYSGINKTAIEEMAESLTKGKKKSFASLAEVLTKLRPSEMKSQLLLSCPTPQHLPIAENYLIKCIIDKVGFKTNLDLETLSEAYPEIKVRKPKGNFGKVKK